MNTATAPILIFAYATGAYFFWNKSTFSHPRRVLFSLTIIPLFFVSMLFNLWLTDTLLPKMMDIFSSAQAENARMVAQGIRRSSASNAEGSVAFAISTPVALLVAYCWYVLFRSWERKTTINISLDKKKKEISAKAMSLRQVDTLGAAMSPRDELMRQYESDKDVIVGLLNEYVSEHGCPCNWHQFEYWVSKEHAPGSQDGYQNTLARSAVNLPCFKQNVIEPHYDIRVTCKHCGRKWHYTSHEWRMEAYQNRLVPDDQRVSRSNLLVGSWFATAGFEPKSTTVLSLEQWYEYMSGKPYPKIIGGVAKLNA